MAASAAQVMQTPVYPVVRNKAAVAAVSEYADLKATVKEAEARIAVLRPVIEAEMVKAKATTVVFGNRMVTRTEVPATPATLPRKITVGMVGDMIAGKPGRAGYFQLAVQ